MKEEFLKFILKTSGCWEWNKKIYSHGYGMFWFDGKGYRAHRASYLLFKGTLIDGLVIGHICKNRACVNPDHLRQVTIRQNVLENSDSLSAINAKKTHCKNGHEFNVENTGIKGGRRYCRTCINNYQKDWRKNANNSNRRQSARSAGAIK